LGLFSFVPSLSRFNRRLHALSYLIPLLLPLFNPLWQRLGGIEPSILDPLPLPVCQNIRALRCRVAKGLCYQGLGFRLRPPLYASGKRFVGGNLSLDNGPYLTGDAPYGEGRARCTQGIKAFKSGTRQLLAARS
jgi:hypothetical protein